MAGQWITCPNCGEKRDVSNRYTSPANYRRDNEDWARDHKSGDCVKKATYKRLGVDEKDPHWGLICVSSADFGVGFMKVWTDPDNGNETISCEHCGAWVEISPAGEVVNRSLTLEDQMGEPVNYG